MKTTNSNSSSLSILEGQGPGGKIADNKLKKHTSVIDGGVGAALKNLTETKQSLNTIP